MVLQEEDRGAHEECRPPRAPLLAPREEEEREEREQAAEGFEHGPRGGLEQHRRAQKEPCHEERTQRGCHESARGGEPAREKECHGGREDEGDKARQARGRERWPERSLQGRAHEGP